MEVFCTINYTFGTHRVTMNIGLDYVFFYYNCMYVFIYTSVSSVQLCLPLDNVYATLVRHSQYFKKGRQHIKSRTKFCVPPFTEV